MSGHRIVVLLLVLSLVLNGVLLRHLLSKKPNNSGEQPQNTLFPSPTANQAQRNEYATATSAQQPSAQSSTQPSATQALHASSTLTRTTLLAQGNQWLHDKQYAALELFLRDYLQQHPLDMDFLLLEAELLVQTALLSDAIAHYYSLKKQAANAQQTQLIEQQIQTLAGHTINQLQKAYAWDNLAIFVEPLLQLEPQNRRYILALAEAYAQQQQTNLMENVLAALDYADPSATRIRQLALAGDIKNPDPVELSDASPSQNTKFTSAISLQQVGAQYVVQGQLSGNQVALLIDTGASITAISRGYFQTLSQRFKGNFIGRFKVNTAGGEVLAPMYQFAELKLNHVSVHDISIMVIPMVNTETVNGLLGMNFLREFDFKLDQRQAILHLSPLN